MQHSLGLIERAMAEVLNHATCTVLSQVTSGVCCFSPGRSEKAKCHSQAPCLQVEAAWRALTPQGGPMVEHSPATLQALTAPTWYSRAGLGEPKKVTWNFVESAMGSVFHTFLGAKLQSVMLTQPTLTSCLYLYWHAQTVVQESHFFTWCLGNWEIMLED